MQPVHSNGNLMSHLVRGTKAQLPILVAATRPKVPSLIGDKGGEVGTTANKHHRLHKGLNRHRRMPMALPREAKAATSTVTPRVSSSRPVPRHGMASASTHTNDRIFGSNTNSDLAIVYSSTLTVLIVTQRKDGSSLGQDKTMTPSCSDLEHL